MVIFFCEVCDEQCKGCSNAFQWYSIIQVQHLIRDQYFVHEVCTRSTCLKYEEENDGSVDLIFMLYIWKIMIHVGRRTFNMY